MTWYGAIIYGLIQGLSEFLPVSSSGHLALLPHFLKMEDPGVLFDLMMHVGTALAILVYFHKRILRLIKELPKVIQWGSSVNISPEVHYIRYFVVSTICSVFLILVLKDVAEQFGRNPRLIAFNLIFFGFILYLSDRRNEVSLPGAMETASQWKRSITIGLAQALAIFPGVSRSGITISAGRFSGLSRLEASSYSFLLSLPIIFAGALKELPDYLKSSSGNESYLPLILGVAVSFLVGILTIHFFLKLVAKTSLLAFFIYRVLIALLVLFIVR